MKEKALIHYHGPERYNCAQAVLKSAEKHQEIGDEKIAEFRKSGGGQARDGLCGALFAAKTLMTDETCKENARSEFLKKGGSLKCREIRGGGRMSCSECVATAAELAEKCFISKMK